MATNTLSAAFRKIDVDQYNEDNYREDEVVESQSPLTGPDEAEVNQLLNQWVCYFLMHCYHSQRFIYNEDSIYRGNLIEALKIVLRNAPLASTNQQVKVSFFLDK